MNRSIIKELSHRLRTTPDDPVLYMERARAYFAEGKTTSPSRTSGPRCR